MINRKRAPVLTERLPQLADDEARNTGACRIRRGSWKCLPLLILPVPDFLEHLQEKGEPVFRPEGAQNKDLGHGHSPGSQNTPMGEV